MKLYGFEFSFSSFYKENKKYHVTEEFTSSVSMKYKLTLHNNQYRKVTITSDNSFDKIIPNQKISFIVEDVISFSANIGYKEIRYFLEKNGTSYLKDYWLYHTFLPILLTFENIYYFLHAGAIEVDEKPILFVANSFGGKSTITDFFIKKGHFMISDDKVAIYEKDNQIYSVPSYPYHRPYRKMEDLGMFVENFAKEAKPINCIFNLKKSDSKSKINIIKMSGIEKFKTLKYATDINLPIYKKERFIILTNIVNKVDVYDITIPWDLNRLEEVYQTIVQFIKNKKANQYDT